MNLSGKIDSSFQTEQRDLFTSGMVAEIGVNAYAVWSAIKYHVDFETGEACPGVRRLGEVVGLSKSAADRAVDVLEKAKLVRVVRGATKRRGQTYIARERLCVRLGGRVLCTIVIDYIPAKHRARVKQVEDALSGHGKGEIWAECEIIPGEGFAWDSEANLLRGRVNAADLPKSDEDVSEFRALGEAMLGKKRLPKK